MNRPNTRREDDHVNKGLYEDWESGETYTSAEQNERGKGQNPTHSENH